MCARGSWRADERPEKGRQCLPEGVGTHRRGAITMLPPQVTDRHTGASVRDVEASR